MASSPDVVDLTESSPEKEEQASAKSKRPRDAEKENEAARQAIMAFAKKARRQQPAQAAPGGAAARGKPSAELEGVPCPSASGEAVSGQGSAEEEVQARQRIMDFARGANAERGLPATALQAGPPSGMATSGTPGAEQDASPPDAAAAAAAAPASGNLLLAQLHAERLARQRQQQPHEAQQRELAPPSQLPPTRDPDAPPGVAAAPVAGRGAHDQQQQKQQGRAAALVQAPGALSLLTYNLWFREDVEVEARMQAVGGIIAAKGYPDFLCFQEVTPLILALLQQSPWWDRYAAMASPNDAPYFTMLLWRKDTVQVTKAAAIPFENSVMGRDLKCVCAMVGGLPVKVATTHLESPLGYNQLYSRQRVAQCKQAAALLDQIADGDDVLFAGDANWNPDDGQPPLPAGWCDTWLNLYPTDPGLTYDPKANPMLNPRSRIRRRLDRAFCRLGRWRLAGMEMVGRQPLPGLRHEGRPVLPSDHFGLLLQLVRV